MSKVFVCSCEYTYTHDLFSEGCAIGNVHTIVVVKIDSYRSSADFLVFCTFDSQKKISHHGCICIFFNTQNQNLHHIFLHRVNSEQTGGGTACMHLFVHMPVPRPTVPRKNALYVIRQCTCNIAREEPRARKATTCLAQDCVDLLSI